jgi:hypothetical protein
MRQRHNCSSLQLRAELFHCSECDVRAGKRRGIEGATTGCSAVRSLQAFLHSALAVRVGYEVARLVHSVDSTLSRMAGSVSNSGVPEKQLHSGFDAK